MASKVLERIHAESASRLLGEGWNLVEIPEPLDFEVHRGENIFGLEHTQVFKGQVGASGSAEKRNESGRQRMLAQLARSYYQAGGVPIRAQFLGSLPVETVGLVQSMVQNAPDQEFERQVFKVGALKVFITRIPNSFGHYNRWDLVNDAVGWVGSTSHELLQAAIDAKQPKLAAYHEKYEDIELLLVADRILNSGKLRLTEVPLLRNPGFRRILFLSYPESIHQIA